MVSGDWEGMCCISSVKAHRNITIGGTVSHQMHTGVWHLARQSTADGNLAMLFPLAEIQHMFHPAVPGRKALGGCSRPREESSVVRPDSRKHGLGIESAANRWGLRCRVWLPSYGDVIFGIASPVTCRKIGR